MQFISHGVSKKPQISHLQLSLGENFPNKFFSQTTHQGYFLKNFRQKMTKWRFFLRILVELECHVKQRNFTSIQKLNFLLNITNNMQNVHFIRIKHLQTTKKFYVYFFLNTPITTVFTDKQHNFLRVKFYHMACMGSVVHSHMVAVVVGRADVVAEVEHFVVAHSVAD